jgi:hypothetical protein
MPKGRETRGEWSCFSGSYMCDMYQRLSQIRFPGFYQGSFDCRDILGTPLKIANSVERTVEIALEVSGHS